MLFLCAAFQRACLCASGYSPIHYQLCMCLACPLSFYCNDCSFYFQKTLFNKKHLFKSDCFLMFMALTLHDWFPPYLHWSSVAFIWISQHPGILPTLSFWLLVSANLHSWGCFLMLFPTQHPRPRSLTLYSWARSLFSGSLTFHVGQAAHKCRFPGVAG